MIVIKELPNTSPTTFCGQCGREATYLMEKFGTKYKLCYGCAMREKLKINGD